MILIDLEGKSDREILILLVQASNAITERLDKINGRCVLHDDRLRRGEAFQNRLLGIGPVLVVAVPIIITLAIRAFAP